MSFGRKLKEARKEAGYTQEQLAEQMNVSRSAVAKWETGKGMPDIDNIKLISQLINVSIDYLLDEDEKMTFNEIKEPINLSDYEKFGNCRSREDAVCARKHADADSIIPLVRMRKLSVKEWIVDTLTFANVLQIGDYLDSGLIAFYLVEKGGKQYLVSVTKDFITTKDLAEKINQKKFIIGKYQFKKMGYELI